MRVLSTLLETRSLALALCQLFFSNISILSPFFHIFTSLLSSRFFLYCKPLYDLRRGPRGVKQIDGYRRLRLLERESSKCENEGDGTGMTERLYARGRDEEDDGFAYLEEPVVVTGTA